MKEKQSKIETFYGKHPYWSLFITVIIIGSIYAYCIYQDPMNTTIFAETLRNPHTGWLQFWGTIFGGALTLGGVMFSLKHKEKQNAISRMPILEIDIEIADFLNKDLFDHVDISLKNSSGSPLWIVPDKFSLSMNNKHIAADLDMNGSTTKIDPSNQHVWLIYLLENFNDKINPDSRNIMKISLVYEGTAGTLYRQDLEATIYFFTNSKIEESFRSSLKHVTKPKLIAY